MPNVILVQWFLPNYFQHPSNFLPQYSSLRCYIYYCSSLLFIDQFLVLKVPSIFTLFLQNAVLKFNLGSGPPSNVKATEWSLSHNFATSLTKRSDGTQLGQKYKLLVCTCENNKVDGCTQKIGAQVLHTSLLLEVVMMNQFDLSLCVCVCMYVEFLNKNV